MGGLYFICHVETIIWVIVCGYYLIKVLVVDSLNFENADKYIVLHMGMRWAGMLHQLMDMTHNRMHTQAAILPAGRNWTAYKN